jgi:hypothetical protein
MDDILVQGRQLDGHGNVWFALYVAPAAKDGILHVLCYYSVKATRNDDGPKNNAARTLPSSTSVGHAFHCMGI